MRMFITVARKHDEENFSVVVGPEVPSDKQSKDFKAMIVGEHDYAEIQLWSSSGGMIKRKKFSTPQKSLEDNTVPELKALADRENIDHTGASTKAELIAAIERGRTINRSKGDPSILSDLTIAELDALAKSEGADTTGAKVKQDYIDAIAKQRKAAGS